MDDYFRPIEGYPGYKINQQGHVESCWTRRGRAVVLAEKWHLLKPIRRQGYCTVNLARGGKKTALRIHRLVLEAFVGPCPVGLVGCHNDGNRSNNLVENLRWDTHQSNADDALRHGTRARGSRCGATKLLEDDVIEIRRMRSEGETFGDLAARFQVTKENIKAIVNGRSWRHLLDGHVGDDIKGLVDLEGRGPGPGAVA